MVQGQGARGFTTMAGWLVVAGMALFPIGGEAMADEPWPGAGEANSSTLAGGGPLEGMAKELGIDTIAMPICQCSWSRMRLILAQPTGNENHPSLSSG